MATSNGRLAWLMLIVGVAGGTWSMTSASHFDPYQRLIDSAAAGRPARPSPADCAALGPLSRPAQDALRCPALSSAR